MTAYYNDNDPNSAAWLRELIIDGLIAPGDVDGRSIKDVVHGDLKGYTQAHFFGGIGGWSLALRLAGWPDDRAVWTGSCPCPPFSAAGKKQRCPACGGRPVPCPRRTGYFICIDCEHAWLADERHLWPEFWRLIRDCRPATVLGEQVASADGRIWLAGVRASMERIGYAVGAADLAAASVGAPHIRQRLFWVADAECERTRPREPRVEGQAGSGRDRSPVSRKTRRMAVSDSDGCDQARGGESATGDDGSFGDGGSGGMGESFQSRLEGLTRHGDDGNQSGRVGPSANGSIAPTGGNGFWGQFDILNFRDGKTRRVEAGTFPLAHGVSGRVGLLRGYGNAIVPEVAAEFIEAYCESAGIALAGD